MTPDSFTPCRRNSCEDGWTWHTAGTTGNRNTLKAGERGVQRCECWMLFLCACFECARVELAAVLVRRAQDRAKARGR
jgi:hypothetical protein